MVRVRDEARHDPQHCEGLNLQVGGVGLALALIQGHQGVALLIHIQVLHQAMVQEVVEVPLPVLELGDVVCRHSRHAAVTDDERPAHPATARLAHWRIWKSIFCSPPLCYGEHRGCFSMKCSFRCWSEHA